MNKPETGEEIISQLLDATPFQKMRVDEQIEFLDSMFGVDGVTPAEIIECGDDKNKFIDLIKSKRKRG
jgi:hypothetical protein